MMETRSSGEANPKLKEVIKKAKTFFLWESTLLVQS